MVLFVKNASEVLTMENGIGLIRDGSILIDDGIFKAVGSIHGHRGAKTIDARGCVVMPGLIDSHTHLVFAGTREDEFAMKVGGVGYEAIARAGGGIMNSVRATRQASEKELEELGRERMEKIVRHGTTTVEIKSGYGLSLVEELKMLRVINRLKNRGPLDVIPTYLVHTIPPQMKRRDYLDLVSEEIIPNVAKNGLAIFCDVFCDKIAFSVGESRKILTRAAAGNLKLKIHADEFSNSGGARLAARLPCVSADHLLYTTKGAIKEMKKAGVIPTLLPGTSVFLQIKKKPDIKAFIKTHSPVAIASDFNPGSCLIYAMPKIIALACLQYGLPIEAALLGATKNAAMALDLVDRIGTIEKGKQADLVIFGVDHYRKIPYYFGEDIVRYTIKKGKVIYGKNR
jgi:imidazolonepropionase